MHKGFKQMNVLFALPPPVPVHRLALTLIP